MKRKAMDKFTLVDKKPRKVLSEGRNYGVGFAFAKRKGNELILVGPISPCREYLNDQLGAEFIKGPVSSCGYDAKYEGLLDDENIYIVIGIMPYFSGGSYGEAQKKETDYLAENFKLLEGFVNQIEEKLKISGKTEIQKLKENRYVLIVPKWWAGSTYLISLHSLLIRSGIESFYKEGDALEFFKNSTGTDSWNIQGGIHEKLLKLIKGQMPKQDKEGIYWHGRGIRNQEFA